MPERKTIGSAVSIVAVQDGKDAAVMAFNPSLQFYDADNGGNAVETADYPISFFVMVGNTTVVPTSLPVITFEGDDTSGISVPAAGNTGFNIRVSQNAHPNCRIKVKTSVVKDGLTYVVNGYIPVAAIKMGPQGGSTSQLSKMYYYAGVYSSSKTYSLTSTQAPYVMYGTDFFVLDNAANGGAGINARNITPASPNLGGNPWTKMDSEMKYYIAEAVFANFAKLGSAIFSGDFMLSQYGSLVGYKGFNIPVSNTNYYQRADASNMIGNIETSLHESNGQTSVNNTSYNEELSRLGVSLEAGKQYMIVIQADAASDRGVTVKLTTSVSYWDSVFERTITDENPVVINFSVWENGAYKLYFKRTGSSSTNPKITYTMVSLDAFRPNAFIDYKTGFLYSKKGQFDEGVFNKGFFGDVTIEGRLNNLITVIDWDKGIGRDKIIKAYYHQNNFVDYTGSGVYDEERYYIDVLACGNFIVIKSLPEYGNGIHYRLPYYALSDLQDRGHTRDMNGDAHIMSPDEMRQLIGRKLTIKVETQQYYTKLVGVLSLSPFQTSTSEWVARGMHYFVKPTSPYTNNHYNIGLNPQVIHIECMAVVWSTNNTGSVNYQGYGYIWTGSAGIDIAQSTATMTDGIDSDWNY